MIARRTLLTSPCLAAAARHCSVHCSISRKMAWYCGGSSCRLSASALSTNDDGRMVSSQSKMIMALPLAAVDDGGGDMVLLPRPDRRMKIMSCKGAVSAATGAADGRSDVHCASRSR